MAEIFYRSQNLVHRKDNFYVHSQNTIKFGNKILGSLRAHIWNLCPENEFHKMSYTYSKTYEKVVSSSITANYCKQVKENYNLMIILI